MVREPAVVALVWLVLEVAEVAEVRLRLDFVDLAVREDLMLPTERTLSVSRMVPVDFEMLTVGLGVGFLERKERLGLGVMVSAGREDFLRRKSVLRERVLAGLDKVGTDSRERWDVLEAEVLAVEGREVLELPSQLTLLSPWLP